MTDEVDRARSAHTEEMLARADRVRASIDTALLELAQLTADLRQVLDEEPTP